MTHIPLIKEGHCYYFLSCGETQSTEQLLNVLIHNLKITSTEDYVIAYDTNRNRFYIIVHESNKNRLQYETMDLVLKYLSILFFQESTIPMDFYFEEKNDQEGNPIYYYHFNGDQKQLLTCIRNQIVKIIVPTIPTTIDKYTTSKFIITLPSEI